MNSIAARIPVANPLTLAHVLSPKVEVPSAFGTPLVFVVGGETSERESLERLIRRNDWKAQTFASVQEFLSHPVPLAPSCLILDVSHDCDGLELQKRFAVERSEMSIIFVTSYSDVRMAVQAIKAGAIEFLTKPLMHGLLLGAVQQALECSRATLAQQAEMWGLKHCYATLTRREREVMALVVTGMLNKQVGGELGISEITVKAHRGQVMQKMKANSLAQLVKMAARLRIQTPRGHSQYCSPAA